MGVPAEHRRKVEERKAKASRAGASASAAYVAPDGLAAVRVRGRDPVLRGSRAFDPRYRIASMQRGMIGWSLLNAYYALFLTSFSIDRYLGPFAFTLDFILLFSCLLQVGMGSLFLRLPVRLPVAGILLSLFMLWSVATTLFANGDFGRNLYAPLQYYVIWGFFGIFLYTAVEMGVNLSPAIRPWIIVPWLLLLGLSSVIGFLQFLGVGWARDLSPTQLFGGVFRPTGLTDYTFMFGMQGVVGAMLIGARLLARNLKIWEYLAMGAFVFIILVAQYRSLYYTGIAPILAFVIYAQYQRDRRRGLALAATAITAILAPIILFQEKFAYGLRGVDVKNDTTLQVRYRAWEQLKPVLQARPFTGIGADQNLMFAPNIANIDHFAGTVIDNFYRMVLICYGYTGAVFMIFTLAALGFGLLMRFDAARAPQVRVLTISAIVVFVSLVGVSFTGNSFVYRQVGYSFALLLALGAPSWQERRLMDPVSPIVALARSFAHSPLRRIFPNLGRVR